MTSSTVSVAVGCAVGIPIGVGLLVAFFFWWRLQRRFKKEEQMDQELERAVYDESGFVSFDNSDTLQEPQQEGAELDNDNNNNRKTKYYVPAYRKKINSMTIRSSTRPNNMDSSNNSNNHLDSPQIFGESGDPSTNSLASFQKLQAGKRQVSVYDQMIPIIPSDGQKIPYSTIQQETLTDRSSSNVDMVTPHSNDDLIKNLQNQDFGSYPRRPSSTNISKLGAPQVHLSNYSNSSFHTRESSISAAMHPQGSVENIFATPKNESPARFNDNASPIPNNNIKNSNASNNSTSTNTENGNYTLKNNYDMDDTNMIAEEDQYENEFTNYSENRREFIDSLRPK
ncbi:hypothetical protein NCAS_0A03140 [Naumovozyma castellii]|uniref:Suppressor of lethality of KEX2 GAS1 double null mutant protein 1 n=1 Tax=Naumovozyma castellii TaxID=27288 RepID=G0V5Y3_NAUCA|nr:hypothetical protein NCAS_0A03140 [Naumovozyma castellii CBS 4309]CCC66872.1 hypothetical protein NCAS_0A03140 [Naumovozyma castellii CBS 4309]